MVADKDSDTVARNTITLNRFLAKLNTKGKKGTIPNLKIRKCTTPGCGGIIVVVNNDPEKHCEWCLSEKEGHFCSVCNDKDSSKWHEINEGWICEECNENIGHLLGKTSIVDLLFEKQNPEPKNFLVSTQETKTATQVTASH